MKATPAQRATIAWLAVAVVVTLAVQLRELSGALWRIVYEFLVRMPDGFAWPFFVFSALYVSSWYWDRWFQRIHYLFAACLVAVTPGLALAWADYLLLALTLPLVLWLIMVRAPGRTEAREWRYQKAHIVMTTAVCALSLITGFSHGGRILVVSIVLCLICAIRVGLWWNAKELNDEEFTVKDYWVSLLAATAFFGGGAALMTLLPFAGDTTSGPKTTNRVPAVHASTYLIADNQYHHLDGDLDYPERSWLVTKIVPVGRRPLLQDFLGEFSVMVFAERFRSHATRSAQQDPPLTWTHLGDFADVSCTSEIDRLESVVRHFTIDEGNLLLSIAPGNHDGYFLGNYRREGDETWEAACASPHSTTDVARARRANAAYVYRHFAANLPNTTVHSHSDDSVSFLASVAPMGTVCTGAQQKPVIGVFLDTNEQRAGDVTSLMMIGTTGHLSNAQIDWVLESLSRFSTESPVVVFAHHPFDATTIWAREALLDLFASLDHRLLAYVAAHTHEADFRGIWSYGQGRIPQFIVGSVTDPPQQAALLDVGVVEGDSVAVRMSREYPQLDHCADVTASFLEHHRCESFGELPLEDDSRRTIDELANCANVEDAETMAATLRLLADAAENETYRAPLACLSWAASVLFRHRDEFQARTVKAFVAELFQPETFVKYRQGRYAEPITVKTRFSCSGNHSAPEERWWQSRRDLERWPARF